MKRRMSLVIVATVVVVASLCVAAMAELQAFGIGVGGRSLLVGLRLATYAVGAMGAIVLGLAGHRLAGVVTSIARQFDLPPADTCQRQGVRLPHDLASAVKGALETREASIRQLHSELEDLRIRVRLSDRQKRQTEAIIYSLRDAVVVTDEHDRLIMGNAPAARLLGFDPETARGRAIAECFGAGHGDFTRLLSQSVQSRVEGTRRELVFHCDGEPRTFDAIVACVQDGERVCGAVAVLHDITREKEVSQMKNDFVSHVSHELKTPLASITAYSEMLADGEADDEQTRKEFYEVIQTQAQRLNRLIEDILNISRIESGLIKINKEPVSLAILIEQQMDMIKRYAEEKNIKVTGPAPIVFDQVYADKDMISQVIVNLLSNAVKYTLPGGSVRVGLEVDETAGHARVTVADTGVGIPESEVEHLFEKFYRVGANNKHAKGTGLGLNLVRQIIEKTHSGRVFVTSKVGVGSTFGFELPLACAELVETA